MIHGIGIDVVDIPRFASAMERFGERLAARLFTGAELDYCMAKRRPEVHLAARFAAKESFFKAMGRRMRYSDVEVTRTEDGRPGIRLSDPAAALGLAIDLSISHDGGLGVAETIITRV